MDKVERLLIILIALHSLAFGLVLLWAPSWAFQFGGWEDVEPLFFPRQGGVFHIVVAIGYLIEHFRYRGVLLLLTAKAVATVFLFGITVLGDSVWVIPFSGAVDALMGIVVYLVHRQVSISGSEKKH